MIYGAVNIENVPFPHYQWRLTKINYIPYMPYFRWKWKFIMFGVEIKLIYLPLRIRTTHVSSCMRGEYVSFTYSLSSWNNHYIVVVVVVVVLYPSSLVMFCPSVIWHIVRMSDDLLSLAPLIPVPRHSWILAYTSKPQSDIHPYSSKIVPTHKSSSIIRGRAIDSLKHKQIRYMLHVYIW